MEKTTTVNPAKSHAGFSPWLFVYIVFVCGADNLFNLLFRFHIEPLFSTNIWWILAEPIPKLFFWLLPSYLYLRYVEHVDPLTYLKLKTNVGRSLFWGTSIVLLFDALILSDKYLILHQHFGINTLTPDQWLNVVILVGFMEEIPFRGVIFQKLHERLSFGWAAIISALIFLELHLVYWFSLGKPLTYLLMGSPSIFIFAIIACGLLKRTGGLWGNIVFHSLYDFMTIFFA